MLAAALVMLAVGAMANAKMATQTFTVLAGAGAHDVYPAPDVYVDDTDAVWTPDGQVFFASLAGNYLGRIDLETGTATVLEPPVPRQGARRVWSGRAQQSPHGAPHPAPARSDPTCRS